MQEDPAACRFHLLARLHTAEVKVVDPGEVGSPGDGPGSWSEAGAREEGLKNAHFVYAGVGVVGLRRRLTA